MVIINGSAMYICIHYKTNDKDIHMISKMIDKSRVFSYTCLLTALCLHCTCPGFYLGIF